MTLIKNPIGSATALGQNATIEVTPTITANSAYSSGMAIGGVMTLQGAVSQQNGHSRLEGVVLLDRANQKPAGYLIFFEAKPGVSGVGVWTDKTQVVAGSDDINICGVVPVSSADWVTIPGTTRALADVPYAGRLMQGQDAAALYAVFVTISTPTFNTNNDFKAEFKFSYAD